MGDHRGESGVLALDDAEVHQRLSYSPLQLSITLHTFHSLLAATTKRGLTIDTKDEAA
jgi:hypothetical protein